MARYRNEMPLWEDPNSSFADIYYYLTEAGYEYEETDGENVFRKGNGWVSSPTFVKVSYSDTTVLLEAWIKIALLPGVFVGEYGMDGFVGALAKGNMKRAVKWIEARLGGSAQQLQPTVSYQQPMNGAMGYPADAVQAIPQGQYVSISDYRCNYTSAKFKKDIKSLGIVGYVLCGIGLLNFLLAGPVAVVDTAIQLGLTLGCHLKKSKGCAIAMIVYGVFNVVMGLAMAGTPSGWGWLALGIGFFNQINKVDKEYKELMLQRGEDAY